MTPTNPERRNPLALRNTEAVALASKPRGPTTLPYAQIRTDGGTQMRAAIDEVTADEYAQELRQGAAFPPVVVFYDGSDHWLGDGFHRVQAYFLVYGDKAKIPCDVRPGTRRDAVLCAAGANAVHGLRRTNADKRRAVETLLRDEEWSQWSDREIARRCHVTQPFVSKLHHDLTDNGYQSAVEMSASKPPWQAGLTDNGYQSRLKIRDNEHSSENDLTDNGYQSALEVGDIDRPSKRDVTDNDYQSTLEVGDNDHASQDGFTDNGYQSPPDVRTYVTRHGTVATMNVEGQKQAGERRKAKTEQTARTVGETQRDHHASGPQANAAAGAESSSAGSDEPSKASSHRQARIDELLTLYRAVLSSLGEYGALTGRHTHTPAVRRALEPLIEELKENRVATGSGSG